MELPVYRKLANGASIYRIEAEDRFTELQRVGTSWLVHTVLAERYPERVRIVELLEARGEEVLLASPEEFEAAWSARYRSS